MPRRASPATGGCSGDGVSRRAVSAHVIGTAGGNRNNDSFVRPGQASWPRRPGDQAEFQCGVEGDARGRLGLRPIPRTYVPGVSNAAYNPYEAMRWTRPSPSLHTTLATLAAHFSRPIASSHQDPGALKTRAVRSVVVLGAKVVGVFAIRVARLTILARLLSPVDFGALLTSKWVEVQVGATRSYAIWAVTA